MSVLLDICQLDGEHVTELERSDRTPSTERNNVTEANGPFFFFKSMLNSLDKIFKVFNPRIRSTIRRQAQQLKLEEVER